MRSVQVFESDDLDDVRRAAIVDVCVAAHDNEEFRMMFVKYFAAGARHFLGYDGDTLVSHAVVSTRGVQAGNGPVLHTAFVDAVSTLPAYQNRGYGGATMKRLADSIDDYEIGCLQTDRSSFYEHLGWELWRGPLAGRGDNGLIPTPEQRGVMVLRVRSTPPLDLDALLSIECQPERIWE